MFNVDEENGVLAATGQPETGLWFPERPLQYLNSWTGQWEPLPQVAYYGNEYHIGKITTYDLTKVKVRYAPNNQSPN